MSDKNDNIVKRTIISNENELLRFMIRPCAVYAEEYDECTSIRGRFHQYFIFGSSVDCSNWKRAHQLCTKLETNPDDTKAMDELIENEKNRRHERLLPHYQNDVWKKRSSPPTDWDKPLPAWLEEENKNSFLAIKAAELRDPNRASETERRLCVIL